MRTVRGRIGNDIRVSQSPGRVFLYAASAHSAVQVKQVVRDAMTEHNVSARVRCDQWNPIKQSWTSHEDLMNAERQRGGGGTSSPVRAARTTRMHSLTRSGATARPVRAYESSRVSTTFPQCGHRSPGTGLAASGFEAEADRPRSALCGPGVHRRGIAAHWAVTAEDEVLN